MNAEYIKLLEARIVKLEQLVARRAYNQIQLPLDEMSKAVLSQSIAAATSIPNSGTGSPGGTTIYAAFPVTVPANPSSTLKVLVNGSIIELLVK